MILADWNIEKRDAYSGPPPGLLPIKLVWTDPPIVHKTLLAEKRIREIWYPYLAEEGMIIFNSPFNYPDWYKHVESQILEFTNPGDLVADPFCGESTTGLAAVKNDRKYFGCDIDPRALILSQEKLRAYEYTCR
jgi:hypothetical protein